MLLLEAGSLYLAASVSGCAIITYTHKLVTGTEKRNQLFFES